MKKSILILGCVVLGVCLHNKLQEPEYVVVEAEETTTRENNILDETQK